MNQALVANVASHDNFGEPGKIAIMDITENKEIKIKWYLINGLSSLYQIGPTRHSLLINANIHSISQLLKLTNYEIYSKTGIGLAISERIRWQAKAVQDNKIYKMQSLILPLKPRIYVDIETDLNQKKIWMIGVYSEKSKTYYPLLAQTYEYEKDILLQFLNILKKEPNSSICSYSGTKFDEQFLLKRFQHYKLETKLIENVTDLNKSISHTLAIPINNYKVSSLGTYFGYSYKHPQITGFQIPSYYDSYVKTKTKKKKNELQKLLEEYNKDDVMTLHHVIKHIENL